MGLERDWESWKGEADEEELGRTGRTGAGIDMIKDRQRLFLQFLIKSVTEEKKNNIVFVPAPNTSFPPTNRRAHTSSPTTLYSHAFSSPPPPE
jgi:hypothetical protein